MLMSEKMKFVLGVIRSDPKIQVEVEKNFEDNLWWPKSVQDRDMRLIIAGLSTRVSYRMINTYRRIINEIGSMTFHEFAKLDRDRMIDILKPLGLISIRLSYVESMIRFIKENPHIDELSDAEFMSKVDQHVKGASYKVAQCALLYRRGYPNTIMPVDSGMKDVMLPCLGYPRQKTGYGHEIARNLLEKDIGEIDKGQFIEEHNLKIKGDQFNWWAHLSLIYYKRAYCNKANIAVCPLYLSGLSLNRCCVNK